jgi:O-antigen/teichoic acid export membrane protein
MQDLIITLFSRGGTMLIGIAMQSVLAWALGPEGRGEYAACLIFNTFSVAVFTFGLDWASIYFIAFDKQSFNRIITIILSYIFILFIFMWPILRTIIHLPLSFFQQAPIEAFYLSIIWATSNICYLISTSILRGLSAYILLAFITFFKFFFALVITIILLINTKLAVQAPILADLTSNLFTFVFIVFLLIHNWKWRIEIPDLKTLRSIFSYGFRMLVGSIGMVTNLRIGMVLLAFYVSKNELGYFALAMAIFTQMGTVSDSINSIIMPRVSESKDGRPELVAMTSRGVSSFFFITGITILLTANWLVPILFSEQFIPAIALLWILFPGMWFRSISKVLFTYFNGTNMPQIVSYNTLINISLNIILLLYFLPRYGLFGAAYITTVANLLSSFLVIIYFIKKSQIDDLNILFIKNEEFIYSIKKIQKLYNSFIKK